MAYSHGRCDTCNIIWRWRVVAHGPRVTKGEAFCERCGDELRRTAARLAKHIRVIVGYPIRRAEAFARRAELAAARDAALKRS